MQVAMSQHDRTAPDEQSRFVDFLGDPVHELEVEAFRAAFATALATAPRRRSGDLEVLAHVLAEAFRTRRAFRDVLAPDSSSDLGPEGDALLAAIDGCTTSPLDTSVVRRIVVLTHAAFAMHGGETSRDELLDAALACARHATIPER